MRRTASLLLFFSSASRLLPVTSLSSGALLTSSPLSQGNGCMRRAPLALPSRAHVSLQHRCVSGDPPLAELMSRELDEELHRSGKPEEPTLPAGWTVERVPNSAVFRLHHQYEDEKVTVVYTPSANTDVNYHEICVLITRAGGKTLQIDVTIEEGELVLDGIAYHEDGALATDETAEGGLKRSKMYPGPKVSELDDSLLDHFIKYLEKRGINQELAEFISLYSFWAEQQDYEGWLKNVHQFVS